MNRTELISKLTEKTHYDAKVCNEIVFGLEEILTEELTHSQRVRSAFDKAYRLMSYFKSKTTVTAE